MSEAKKIRLKTLSEYKESRYQSKIGEHRFLHILKKVGLKFNDLFLGLAEKLFSYNSAVGFFRNLYSFQN